MSELNLTPAQSDALDISHRRCCVTASAGTGKTFVLTQRYLRHLKAGVSAGKILCLTFTEKAAAEMREKIEREVKKAINDASGAECDNLKKALNDIHHCTISTFHGFCSSVLKEFPIESKTPLGYAVMDGLAERELVANTIEAILEHPGEDLREYAVCLYSAFYANDVPKLIFGLLGKLQVCPEWFKKLETEEGLLKIYHGWLKLCTDMVLDIAQRNRDDTDIQRLMDDFAVNSDKYYPEAKDIRVAYDKLMRAETDEDIVCAADELSSIEFSFKKYNSKIDKDTRARFVAFRNELGGFSPAHRILARGFDDPHTQLMLSVMQALYKITAAVAEKVEAKKAAAGYLNFDDLITSAKSLLMDKKICAVLAKRYEYVLVDEVQDNDTSLTDIINNLAEGDDDNLFIVGDMKQSIYRFRGADPECVQNDLFSKFPGDGKVTLDTNFRTVQRLIDAVNILFTRLYPEGNEEHIPYEPVKAHRNCCPEDAGTLTILRAHKEKGDGNKSTAPKEAALLSRWIGKKVAEKDLLVEDESTWRPAEFRDFAVLVRKNSDGTQVKKAFDAFGIPYHDCSGDKMYTSDEIRDLISVIRAAVCHEEDTALYAALKSPYFGITDAELAFAAYDENKYPQNLWRRLESFAAGRKTKQVNEGDDTDAFLRFAADAKKHLTSALSALELFARAAVSDTLPHLIRLIFETTGIISVYAALPNGTDRISSLRQFLAVSDHISAERGVSVYEFLRIIDTCVENKLDNEYSSDGETSKENRVQIMTYHVSKGLEFPVVALFRVGAKYKDKIENLMADEKYGAGHSALKYPGESESVFKFLQSLIVQKERPVLLCEEKRLFYVGMTRARDHLVLTVTDGGEDESYMDFFSAGGEALDALKEDCDSVEWTPEITAPEASFAGDWCCAVSADEEIRKMSLAAICSELTETKEERKLRHEEEMKRLQEAKRIQENIFRGLCIHEIFEGNNPEETCEKYGCEGELKKFKKALEHFRKSDYMKGVVKEVHELPLKTAAGEMRRADLFVTYDDDSYAVFDYKSSASSSLDAEMRDVYFAQLAEYSDILSAVYKTAEKIPAYLYFVGDEMFVRVV